MNNRAETNLHLALVSDIHHGPVAQTKAGPSSLQILRRVLSQVDSSGAEALIDLGDRINNTTEDDERHMREVAEVMRRLRKPRHHLLGNHDILGLSAEDNARIMGQTVDSRVLKTRGWNLVLWSARPRFHLTGCEVEEHDLTWLREALAALDGPTVLFSHVPFGGGPMTGNYYFEGDPERGASYQDLSELQELVLTNSHVRLAVAGHVHWNSLHTIDGVPFFTIQSMSESFTTWPEPAEAWAELVLHPDHARIQVHGHDSWTVEVPLRNTGRHWLRRPGLPSRERRRAEPGLSRVRGVILDLDGVIYRGDQLLPGATDFLNTLRRTDRHVVAVTNHSGIDARQLWRKLRNLDIALEPEEIVTSIDATVEHLRAEYPGATVHAWGSDALRTALEQAGFQSSAHPDVVVVGYSHQPDIPALTAAAEIVASGAVFLGTNPDPWLPHPNGRIPETGAYLAMVTELTGKRPFVVGKPSTVIADLALARLALPSDEVMVVGDTIATDIATAQTIGAISVLMLTGNAQPGGVISPRPDYIFPDLPALIAVLQSVRLETTATS